MFASESPASLTDWIWESEDVDQSLGKTIYSVESNLITSLGEMENRHFYVYPSDPAENGCKSVDVGSNFDLPPFKLEPEEPLSIQI